MRFRAGLHYVVVVATAAIPLVITSASAATTTSAVAAAKSEIPGLPPTTPALVLGAAATVLDPTGNPPTWYAIAESYDSGTATAPTRPVYGGYVSHWDLDGYSMPSQIVSGNRGNTFTATGREGYETSVRLDDGRVIRADFLGQTSVSTQRRTIEVYYSSDDAATFPNVVTASLNVAPQTFFHPTANFFANSLVQVPGGALLMAGYAVLTDAAGGAVTTALLMQSTDQGRSWTLRSTVGQGTSTLGFSETALVLASNGDLLAVMRSSTYDNLWVRRSADNGVSWTAPPRGIPEFAADSSGNRPFGRINPRLSLLPNGVLALVAGRPDNSVALSYDGTGRTWDVKKTFYANHSVVWPQDLNRGTSGNADLAWTEANRAVLLADTCHAITYQQVHYNKCTWQGEAMSDNTTEYQIKRVMADVLTAGVGKIDLAGKVAAGTVQLGGDLGTAVAGHPRTGNRGAVDGSNEMWSSAVKSGGAGTFDITLDRAYTLSKVGLSLAIGGVAGATVQTRLNAGDPWSTWYTAADQRSYALKYATTPPRAARYVRVLVGASSICPPGVGSRCSQLNEIELYAADVDSFENDPVNGIPRGYSADHTVDDGGVGHLGVWVSQSTSESGSGRVLRIVDDSAAHLPAVRRIDAPGGAKTLGFRFHPERWRPSGTGASSAFMFDVLAVPVAGVRQIAYHLAIWNDGTVRYHDGRGWKQIGAAPVLNPSTSCAGGCVWTAVQVRATTSAATVSVNGTVIGAASRYDRTTTGLTGHQFSASSMADAGETFLVDDVHTSDT